MTKSWLVVILLLGIMGCRKGGTASVSPAAAGSPQELCARRLPLDSLKPLFGDGVGIVTKSTNLEDLTCSIKWKSGNEAASVEYQCGSQNKYKVAEVFGAAYSQAGGVFAVHPAAIGRAGEVWAFQVQGVTMSEKVFVLDDDTDCTVVISVESALEEHNLRIARMAVAHLDPRSAPRAVLRYRFVGPNQSPVPILAPEAGEVSKKPADAVKPATELDDLIK